MRRTIVFLCALGLCLALPATAKINSDYDSTVDFSKYRTWAWGKGTPAPNPLAQKRIEAAIERELAAKGWRRVESGADVLVFTHASVGEETRVDVMDYGYRWGPRRGAWGGGMTTVDVRQIATGTLMVDMVDAGSKQLVWRSVATATLASSAEKSEKKINKTCRKMFKKFPPGS